MNSNEDIKQRFETMFPDCEKISWKQKARVMEWRNETTIYDERTIETEDYLFMNYKYSNRISFRDFLKESDTMQTRVFIMSRA